MGLGHLVTTPIIAYIALGSNLGDSITIVQNAMPCIEQLPQTSARQRSALYQSAPFETTGDDFINAVIAIETALTPHKLLQHLQVIELQFKRQRPYHYAPRTLDLDILLYGDACIQDDVLTIPHPRMQQRAFVLAPLAELVPAQWSWSDSTQAFDLATCLKMALQTQVIQKMAPAF